MCGICGKYNFRTGTEVQKFELKRMADTIAHRGPDDEGYYIYNSLGFGFRRLSIIDLPGGHQPMSDPEEKVWIVFNGEIYNFIELREELQSLGHKFRTKSDTEVIIKGYKQWGIDVLQKLNGMFGLAIWDAEEQKLILVRDRMGIKLVYYMLTDEGIIFASEKKALLSLLKKKPEIDTEAMYLFLRFRFTPSPLTIYKEVKKLAPGTMLIVEKKSEPRIKRWYSYKPTPFDRMPDIDEAKEELLELYQKAVRRQLISDVPLGLLLSGGMDSAMLLSLMKQNGNGWQTYSVGYGESFEDDELIDAKETAQLLNVENHSVAIDQKTFEQALHKVIKHLEEPIAASSIVPMYFVCQKASEKLKVALIGQGPDELFGGYKRHLGIQYGKYWRALPSNSRTLIRKVLTNTTSNETVQRSLYSLDVPERVNRYQQVLSLMRNDEINGLFNEGVVNEYAGEKLSNCWKELIPLNENTDELGGLQFLEIRSTLPDELLMYADKLSMAHGLELRVPFLDQEVVEYVERLDASFKVNWFRRKFLHKKVANVLIPEKIIKRKKRGFAVNVVDDWFKSSLSSNTKDYIMSEDSAVYNYLNKKAVQKLLKNHESGKRDNHKLLFSVVILEEFLRNH